MGSDRRHIWVEDGKWAAVIQAAAHETIRTQENVTTSEWIRRAIDERLQRQSRPAK